MVTIFSKYFLHSLVTESFFWSSNQQMTVINDQHYIDKVLSGDTQAYTFLVDRYKNMVFTLALRMLKNREEAEEVAQDAFVKAYTKLSKFKGDAKFSTWLYKVTYNTSLDRIKKNRKDIMVVPIEEVTERQIKTIDTALEQLEQKEKTKAIQHCLSFLPPDENTLLILFYFEELSLKEISKITKTSVNSLKVKLFRSRKKLAIIMQEKITPEIIEIYG